MARSLETPVALAAEKRAIHYLITPMKNARWEDLMPQKAPADAVSIGDLVEQERRRACISANSMLGQARSVFNRRMLHAYADAGLKLPESIQGFVHAPGFKTPVPEYRPPAEEVIAKTFAAVEDMKDKDRNL